MRNRSPRAVIVLVENVPDASNVKTMAGLLSLESQYSWRPTLTNVRLHCGVPVQRERTVWVGVCVQNVKFIFTPQSEKSIQSTNCDENGLRFSLGRLVADDPP